MNAQSVLYPRARGVRRPREENTTAVEIEELDSEVMRQKSYNYFERYSPYSDGQGNTNRKRQRTLAEQLNDLCLQGQQEQQRQIEVEMRSTDVEMDEENTIESSGNRVQMVVGNLPTVKGMVFGTSRQRSMDRMFRHYTAMANDRSTSTTPPVIRGDELVVYRPPDTNSLFTPEQIEDLRARHNLRKKRQYSKLSVTKNEWSSGRFQQLDDASDVDADISSCTEDSDLEMCVDVGHTPHLAGVVSHKEWFLEDTEEEDEDL